MDLKKIYVLMIRFEKKSTDGFARLFWKFITSFCKDL